MAIPQSSDNVFIIANATGPQGLPGPPGAKGVERNVSVSYTVVIGDGYLNADLRSASLVLDLLSLTLLTDVTVMDVYSQASGSRTISALGTVSGVTNPVLVNIAGGFARLIYSPLLNLWSLAG